MKTTIWNFDIATIDHAYTKVTSKTYMMDIPSHHVESVVGERVAGREDETASGNCWPCSNPVNQVTG